MPALDRDLGVRLPPLAEGGVLPPGAPPEGRAGLFRVPLPDRRAQQLLFPAPPAGRLRPLAGGDPAGLSVCREGEPTHYPPAAAARLHRSARPSPGARERAGAQARAGALPAAAHVPGGPPPIGPVPVTAAGRAALGDRVSPSQLADRCDI